MRAIPIWILVAGVLSTCIILLGIFASRLIHSLIDVTHPCQHGGIWNGNACDCGNGVWMGRFCEIENCSNRGKPIKVDGVWGCRCGSIRSDAGLLCTECYTRNCSQHAPECDTTIFENALMDGRRCNQICLPDANSFTCNGLDLGIDGSCVGCNGHGVCGSANECICDRGWYDSPTGEKCSLTCDCSPNAYCLPNLECVCKPGYYNEPACDVTCPGINPDTGQGLACSGHGACFFTATQELGLPHFHPSDTPLRDFATCACEPTYTAKDSFACAYECPHRATVDEACSGHGVCSMNEDLDGVSCTCVDGWGGPRCDCHPLYTCSGHGTCDTTDGTCICDAGPLVSSTQEPAKGFFTGGRCEQCAENWFPEGVCTRFCDPNAQYDGSLHVFPHFSPGFGCWGHGACTWNGAQVGCKCSGNTDPAVYCSECTSAYYPKYNWVENIPDTSYCITRCDDETCHSNGVCNPLHKPGVEPLCLCEVNARGMDTLNASSNCQTCQNGWYPEGRCERFCSAELELTAASGCDHLRKVYDTLYEPIRVVEDTTTRGTIKSRHARGRILNKTITVDCLNCNPSSTCASDGTCVCPAGVTGIECTKTCESFQSTTCGGHGTCSQSALVQWFDPESDVVQCECDPEDPYEPEVRQYYERLGVALDAPPTPEYFGRSCQYHCPTYNRNVCAERGTCTPTPVSPLTPCTRKTGCGDDSGVFCADVPTPWDDYSIQTFQLPSYFESPAPGASMCRNKACVDDLQQQDYEQICVSLLNGLYPDELNGAACSSNGNVCNEALINAFTRGHTRPPFQQHGRTITYEDAWGGNVALVLVWDDAGQFSAHTADVDLDTCLNMTLGKKILEFYSYFTPGDTYTSTCGLNTITRVDIFHNTSWCQQSEIIFQEANVTSTCDGDESFAAVQATTGCIQHDIRSECILDAACIFDTTVEYMQQLDDRCFPLSADACDADPYCLFNDNLKTCDPRSFCRARTCTDTLNDVGIGPMCIPLDTCPQVEDPDQTCSDITQRAVEKASALHQTIQTAEAPLSAEELYFYCWNYLQKDKPLAFTLPPPGDVVLAHADEYMRTAVSILRAKEADPAALQDGRWDEEISVSSDWCHTYEDTRYPADSAAMYNNRAHVYVPLPALIVCGNNTMVSFETDVGYASTLAQWYSTIRGESCVVRKTNEPTSFAPVEAGLDAWRWSHADLDIQDAWENYCDALPACEDVVYYTLRAPKYKSTPLDVHTFWSSSHVIGLFKDAAGTSIRDGWESPLTVPISTPVSHEENIIIEDILQTTSIHVNWTFISQETTFIATPTQKTIPPVKICAVNLNYTALDQPITYDWGQSSPCMFETSVYANGTFVTQPSAIDIGGSVVFAVIDNGTLREGISPTRMDTSFEPDITASTFSAWNYTVVIHSGEATFAFELVGDDDQEALRIDIFDGAVYFRGEGQQITTITNMLQVAWENHQLFINHVPQPYAFRYIPRVAHVYSTKAHSTLRVSIDQTHDGYHFTTPTQAHFTERTRLNLPTSEASTYTFTGQLDGIFELPGIAAVRGDGSMRVEGNSTRVYETITLEVGDLNDAFENPSATHNAILTPLWTPATYLSGEKVLYEHLTYEVVVTSTTSRPNESDWQQLPVDAWEHGARLEVIPPLAVESIGTAVYISDTLESSLYGSGNFVRGETYELNVTGWNHSVAAFLNDVRAWEISDVRPTSLPAFVYVTGDVDVFRYVSTGFQSTCDIYPDAVTDMARYVCGDAPCDWPYTDILSQCVKTRNASVPPGMESLLGARMIDWRSYCSYAHPLDYEWSGVHYGYIWHDQCNASDIVCRDPKWVDTCFARTVPYAETCASSCMDTLRTRVSGSICDRVNDLSNVSKLSGQACDGDACDIEFIPRQFCDTQEAYHAITVDGLNVSHDVTLPFMRSTSCSVTCREHLESIMRWDAWEDMCAALGSGERPGFCSTSSCDCDIGYDGNQCELQCPVGSSDGEEATCSGNNGFCVPSSTEAFVMDTGAQEEAGEYVVNDPANSNIPLWIGGPDAVEGLCQCVQGSGEDCSMKCENSNNGTYGPGLLAQYGICDSNIAAVKPLPPCTRYNADFLTDTNRAVSPNSTTFDQVLLVYPERFFFCNLSVIYKTALNEVEPSSALDIDPLNAWRVLTHVCWPWGDFSARRETRQKPPVYEPSHWYWNLETSLNLVQAWEEDVNASFPVDRTPVELSTVEYIFNVSNELIGVAPGIPGAFEQRWAAYNQHVFVKDPPLNRYDACWAQYNNILLMYGGRLLTGTGDGCSASNMGACDGQDSTELWRFDVSVGGVITLEAHFVAIDGPGIAMGRPFAAADGVAYLWTSALLWELDLTGNWEWVRSQTVVEGSQPTSHAILDDVVLRTDTCGIILTAPVMECLPGEKHNRTALVWNPPPATERACVLHKNGSNVHVDEYILAAFENISTRVEVYLHDLKTMNPFEKTFRKRVQQAIRVPSTCILNT